MKYLNLVLIAMFSIGPAFAQELDYHEQRRLGRVSRLIEQVTGSTEASDVLLPPVIADWRSYPVTEDRDLGPFTAVSVQKPPAERGWSIFVTAQGRTLTKPATVSDLYHLHGTWTARTHLGTDYAFTANPKSKRIVSQEETTWNGHPALQEEYDVTLNGEPYVVEQLTIGLGQTIYTVYRQVPKQSYTNERTWFALFVDQMKDEGNEPASLSLYAGAAAAYARNPTSLRTDSSAVITSELDVSSVAAAVVSIESINPTTGEIAGKGSGFFTDERGWILTNRHVAEALDGVIGDLRITMTGSDEVLRSNCQFEVPSGDVVTSARYDVALIIPASTTLPCPIESILSPVQKNPDTGTVVSMIGYPAVSEGANSLTTTAGQVSGRVLEDGQFKYLKVTAEGAPGHSGSPVLNADGHVVGIVTAGVGVVQRGEGVYQHLASLITPSEQILQEYPELTSVQYTQASTSERPVVAVPMGTWFSTPAERFARAGYLNDFEPNRNVIRQEFITLLVDLLGGVSDDAGQQSFSDIPTTHPAWAHFETAAALGLVKGAGNCYGTLPCAGNPNALINRAEAATLMLRAYGLKRLDSAPSFADAPTGQWFTESIEAAASRCILKGDDRAATVRPADTMNWAEMLVMLHRIYEDAEYPACQARTTAELPQSPAEPAGTAAAQAQTQPGSGAVPCTSGVWECRPISACTKDGQQKQSCTLQESISCANPDRAEPAEERSCVRSGGRIQEMQDRLEQAGQTKTLMERITLQLSGSEAIDALHALHQYEDAIDVYNDLVSGALRYVDWFQHKSQEIDQQEDWLERVEEKFFAIKGTALLRQELEEAAQ